MASYTSAWLVGSVKDLGYYYSIGAALKQITGDRYLYHPTANLSILGKIQADLVAEGFGAATAVLTRDRRVKLASGGGNFTITWDSTALRDLLGFTATLTGAATYTATNVSPLLWSPGKPLMPELSPSGTTGNRRPLAYWTQSPTDGSPFVVAHGERIDQRWSVSHVSQGRMQTSAARIRAGVDPRAAARADELHAIGEHDLPALDDHRRARAGRSPADDLPLADGPHLALPVGPRAAARLRRLRGRLDRARLVRPVRGRTIAGAEKSALAG